MRRCRARLNDEFSGGTPAWTAIEQLAYNSQGVRIMDARHGAPYSKGFAAKVRAVWEDAAGQSEIRVVSSMRPALKALEKMKAAKIKRFERIVARLMKPLGLAGWWIKVSGDSIKHRADCEASPEYTEATLTFDPNRIPDADVVSFAVHELMHCHVEGLAHLAERLAGDDPFKQEMVRIEEERLTTALEKILTPLLVEIAEPAPKGKRRK